jgi:hypothetical protein
MTNNRFTDILNSDTDCLDNLRATMTAGSAAPDTADLGGMSTSEVTPGGRTDHVFTSHRVALAQSRVLQTGMLDKLAEWRSEDTHVTGASARPSLISDQAILVGLLLLASEHRPLRISSLAEMFQNRLTSESRTLPEQLRRSVTWDQGREMSKHQEITMATGMPIYFCDPHSPWQRGSNENTNGLLRQHFPKSTDLSFHGPGILENVAAELNARPRKRHGYRTPAEVLTTLISNPSNQTGVAPTT